MLVYIIYMFIIVRKNYGDKMSKMLVSYKMNEFIMVNWYKWNFELFVYFVWFYCLMKGWGVNVMCLILDVYVLEEVYF